MQKFTDTFVKAAAQGYHWENTGLGLRVGKNARTFITMMGNGKRHTIGRYPLVSLQNARKAASEFQAARKLKLYSPAALSFKDALPRFIQASKAKNRPATTEDYELRLNRHWLPLFGSKKLSDISRADVSSLDHPSASERQHALVVLKVFFSWAIKNGLTSIDPTYRMPSITRYKPRERVLTHEELSKIIREVQVSSDAFYRTVYLIILTGCRRSEIQHIKVNGDTAILPADHAKNGREHVFPLPASAVPLLQTPLNFNGWSKSTARLKKKLGFDNWTLHDLRRTYATIHAQIGTPIHITERLLNHVSGSFGGIVSTYQQYTHQPEMRRAVDNYEAYLQSVTRQG